jgi:hypothetical protein
MNFSYEVRFNEGDYLRRMRELFRSQNPLTRFFAEDNARFGAYYSQDYLGCRLKVEVKPAHRTDDRAIQFLAFSFNFHKDLERDTAVNDIEAMMARWNEARTLARSIAEAAL